MLPKQQRPAEGLNLGACQSGPWLSPHALSLPEPKSERIVALLQLDLPTIDPCFTPLSAAFQTGPLLLLHPEGAQGWESMRCNAQLIVHAAQD